MMHASIYMKCLIFNYSRPTQVILGVGCNDSIRQVWSEKREIIEIPLDLPGLQTAARVNFPHNCYSLDIAASEAVRREEVFLLKKCIFIALKELQKLPKPECWVPL